MEDFWPRFVGDLTHRPRAPTKLRFALQPLMSAIFAIRAGLKDAEAGKPVYFWALITSPGHRADMLKDGWKSVGKVFLLALTLDVVYQLFVLHVLWPGETIVVAFILSIAPYLIVRGLVNRLAARR